MNTEMNTPSKIIINENYNEDMGYLVERYDNGSIYTTFWVFTNNGEKINEKIIIFKSLRHLYDESKIYVDSGLTNQILLHESKYKMIHESKYKMMSDLIKYYENIHTEIL
jgi:hypothetical protein